MTAGVGDQNSGDCDLVIVLDGDCDESLTLPPPPGELLTPSSGDGSGHGLWVRDDQDGHDEIPPVAWDQGCLPGPPRNVPLVHIISIKYSSRPPRRCESMMSLTLYTDGCSRFQ